MSSIKGYPHIAKTSVVLVAILALSINYSAESHLSERTDVEPSSRISNNLQTPEKPSVEPRDAESGLRRKRSQQAALVGVGAFYKLVRGLKVVGPKSDGQCTVFEKRGDHRQPLIDFHSVNPKNVREVEDLDGRIMTVGEVGDRRLVVKKYAWGTKPSLEIIHLNPTGDHFLDVIIYTMK